MSMFTNVVSFFRKLVLLDRVHDVSIGSRDDTDSLNPSAFDVPPPAQISSTHFCVHDPVKGCSVNVTHFSPLGLPLCDYHGVAPSSRVVLLFMVRGGKVLAMTIDKKHPNDYLLPIAAVDKAFGATDADVLITTSKLRLGMTIADPKHVFSFPVDTAGFNVYCSMFIATWVKGLPRYSGDGYLLWVDPAELCSSQCRLVELNKKAVKYAAALLKNREEEALDDVDETV